MLVSVAVLVSGAGHRPQDLLPWRQALSSVHPSEPGHSGDSARGALWAGESLSTPLHGVVSHLCGKRSCTRTVMGGLRGAQLHQKMLHTWQQGLAGETEPGSPRVPGQGGAWQRAQPHCAEGGQDARGWKKRKREVWCWWWEEMIEKITLRGAPALGGRSVRSWAEVEEKVQVAEGSWAPAVFPKKEMHFFSK